MSDTVIIGIGNRLRGDDGVGCLIVDMLSDLTQAMVISAGTSPEDYIDKILRENPKRILFIDACRFGGQPGDFALFSEKEFDRLIISGFSTHTLPLSIIAELLRRETDAEIFLLGIEPGDCQYGEHLSSKVKKALPLVIEFIRFWLEEIERV